MSVETRQWSEGEVAIATNLAGQMKTVPATIHPGGCLAVHPREGQLAVDHWTLTHVPTGYALRYDFASRAEAQAAAERVLALPVDWPNYLPDQRQWKRLGADLQRRVREAVWGTAAMPS